jgi:hypothetical protein
MPYRLLTAHAQPCPATPRPAGPRLAVPSLASKISYRIPPPRSDSGQRFRPLSTYTPPTVRTR